MRKQKYDLPTNTFPYKITRRLNVMSVPRRYIFETMEGMPAYTNTGIRKSALSGQPTDRVNDIAWPWIRRLILLKKMYRNRFSPERLERIDRMIEAANATLYSKLANCVIDLKKQDNKDVKKKKGWTETDWKKHMDYIGLVAAPKKEFKPPPIKRGKSMPLDALLPRINEISSRPDFKCYKRLSKEVWYRNPEKLFKMGLSKLDTPSSMYKLPKRLILLSQPRKYYVDTEEGMPALTQTGTRKSALCGSLSDKNSDIAWPYLRRLMILKRMYKNRFNQERLERIDRMIEASNATIYSKLANCSIDFKKNEIRDSRRKKGWSDTEWKKHMEYISQIAGPKKVFPPPAVKRGKYKPLKALMPRLKLISSRPDFKCYKRMSQEDWYRNPAKVAESALKYKITDRTQKLAVARAMPHSDD